MGSESLNVPSRLPSRRYAVARGLGSLLGLAGLLVALPIVLWSAAGNPAPDHWPAAGEISDALRAPATDDTLLLAIMRAAAWLLWAVFCVTTVIETVAHTRGRSAPRLPGLHQVQHLTRTMITSITVMLSTPPAVVLGSTPPPQTSTAVTDSTPAAAFAPDQGQAADRGSEWHTVRPRETLWGIAVRKLGDGQRWREIARLNHIDNPRTLQPRTKLRLPPRRPPASGAPARPGGGGGEYVPQQPRPGQPGTRQPDSPAPPSSREPRPEPSAPAAPSAPGTATPNVTEDSNGSQPRGDQDPTVRLPSGGLLGLGLAASILVAVAATRLHRRRRRVPNPDLLALADPEPVQPPAVRAVRAHMAAHTDQPTSDETLVARDLIAGPPTHLNIGVRDGQPVIIALAGMTVALTGAGARDCARALATDLIAASHHSRVQLVVTEDEAVRLFPGGRDGVLRLADQIPGLVVTRHLAAALQLLETEIIHRARMLSDHDVPDVRQLRAADPSEPLPAIVLVAGPQERLAAPLQAALHRGDRYGIAALMLGNWPDGTCCDIDPAGRVISAVGPQAEPWRDTQLFHLTGGDAEDLLQVVSTSHGHTPAPWPAPTPSDPAQDAANPISPAASPTHPAPAAARAASDLLVPAPRGEQQRLVTIRMLGPTRVHADGGEVVTGLRRISRDLLVLLALHPNGLTRDQGIESLFPDRDLESGSTMWHTAINNTRKVLRAATGQRGPMFVTHLDGRYRLDTHLIDVDLWQLLTALNEAAKADTDPDRIPPLARLADLYTGELAEDLAHEWAEAERERIRRTATDALVRLARLLEHDGRHDDAVMALQKATDHDPYSEPLARELMALQGRLGRYDAVHRTFRLLKRRLEDLGVDPDDETEQLVISLQRKGGQRSR